MVEYYALIYPLAWVGLIAVWPLGLIMLDVKAALSVNSATVGWVVRGCCALAIAFFVLMWCLAFAL